MPQDIIIVHAQETGLHLHRTTETLAGVGFPRGILDGIVATLDAAVEVAPQGSQGVVAVGFKVEQTVPVLVVGVVRTAYPEVVAHDLTVHGKVVIGCAVPVGPVQRSVGSSKCLVKSLLIGVIFLKGFTRRVLHLKKIVAAGRQHEKCCTQTCYD